MKKILLTASVALSCLCSSQTWAACASTTEAGSNNPGIFLGVTYAFGSKEGFGITLQATSTRRDDRGIVAAGVSYFPASGNFGIPVGVGYQKSHAAVIGGYDFLLNAPVLQGGYTNTSKDKTTGCVA